jgi:hypothetical protein
MLAMLTSPQASSHSTVSTATRLVSLIGPAPR